MFLFPTTWGLGPRQHLFGDGSALNKFSQPTIKKERKRKKKKKKEKKKVFIFYFLDTVRKTF